MLFRVSILALLTLLLAACARSPVVQLYDGPARLTAMSSPCESPANWKCSPSMAKKSKALTPSFRLNTRI